MTVPVADCPPIVWSIAGVDSGGGAGLSADQRAADAFGLHLCPVVAAVTAQNSQTVARIAPVPDDVLHAQLATLAADMPPAVIKTGLLASAGHVRAVARWVDKLRATRPSLALVVDPVLRASTGAAFADADMLHAYVRELLPRATLITPNAAEALRLLAAAGQGTDAQAPLPERLPGALPAPEQARRLRALGVQAVAITGGDAPPGPCASAHADRANWALDWIDTPHASGWLALPRQHAPHTHGTGCTFATSAACALALGFVPADALVLAKMATAHAIAHGRQAGQGAGPVVASPGFAQPEHMPLMSWGDAVPDWPPAAAAAPFAHAQHGLYAIVDSAERVRQALAAGVRLVQLRIKTPAQPDAAWQAALRPAIAQALADCRAAGATLVVNDHWPLAMEMVADAHRAAEHGGAGQGAATAPLAAADAPPAALALHLGQEDLLALGEAGRAALAASGLPLGISSHSLWELARARSLHPWYVACGPVWPTLTKAMPWQPQGLHNLRWWVRMAGAPVVAIGGILEHAQAQQAAQTGAAAICIVRGLGQDMQAAVPGWQSAIAAGRAATATAAAMPAAALPKPSLPHIG